MTIANHVEKHNTSAAGRNDSSASLVVHTNNASRTDRPDSKIHRFALQAAARELLPNKRVAWCLRRVIPGKEHVEVWRDHQSTQTWYGNLIRCSRMWECPVCAATITERRRKVLTELLSRTIKISAVFESGRFETRRVLAWHTAMLTFTLAHRKEESAAEVIARIQNAYGRFWRGRAAVAMKQRYRISATLRAIEVTYGDSGWHPHIHTLLISDSIITPLLEVEMIGGFKDRWMESVSKAGGRASWAHGVDLTVSDTHLAGYIEKFGSGVDKVGKSWTVIDEITKYPVKKATKEGQTLWQLLADYGTGDVAAGELWLEGVGALHGVMHLRPSNGLWKLLGATDSVGADEVMAEDEITPSAAILARLTLDQWRLVVKHDRRGELLEIARSGDVTALYDWLGRLP